MQRFKIDYSEAVELPVRVALAMLQVDRDIRKDAIDFTSRNLPKDTFTVFDVSNFID